MKILAVGDWYMPPHYFADALATLGGAHDIRYFEIDANRPFDPASPSERKLREYLGSPEQLIERIKGAEVLVVQGAPVTDEVLDASPELGLVCCARGGPVNVDIDAVTDRGLPLVTTPGKNAEAVADLTVAFLVMLARVIPKGQRFIDQGGQVGDNWQGAHFMGHDLRGRTLGIVGYGQIGLRVAKRVRGFGMQTVVYDPYVTVEDAEVRQLDTLDELLRSADFVSLHARATAETESMIDAEALALMRPGAFLVNTARETLVDEEALDGALAAGRLGGAALDVFTDGEMLARRENVVLTPHVGGATYETLARGADMIAAEIRRFAAGEPLINVFNRDALAV
ncbi:MAG TPA: NAD(P)-dependent oxidoreductase [Solirubrobacteraceae bacterium]|nr:NAD(P)-dependent oxidoreductase [Solirubrobacteraceae bacterium]